MTGSNNTISAAAITDRGLSEKRPLNEDSYLCDVERALFAVADGVGGAQAGEVASQTAMEVIDEAFRHQLPDVDNEDLMEIAIQRANASIFSMSREHPKLSMMATTIVALQIDGDVATIGHVGDSRIYSLLPTGELRRETRDHSVVEEEVQAGRMTPDQAANHPSRNVISRALGAEATVEVDMKSLRVPPGTIFLLCSDGITRHMPDAELAEILKRSENLREVCSDLKRICFERGAEDNLTALLVRLDGAQAASSTKRAGDDERTLSNARSAATVQAGAATIAGADGKPYDIERAETLRDFDPATVDLTTGPIPSALLPAAASSTSALAPDVATSGAAAVITPVYYGGPQAVRPSRAEKKQGGGFKTFLKLLGILIVLGLVAALAFFAGMFLQARNQPISLNPVTPQVEITRGGAANTNSEPGPQVTPAAKLPEPGSMADLRARVDSDPTRMATTLSSDPMVNDNPDLAYLYGRALLLSGKYPEAAAEFRKATNMAEGRTGYDSVRIDNALATFAAEMKSGAETKSALDELARVLKAPILRAPAPSPSATRRLPDIN